MNKTLSVEIVPISNWRVPLPDRNVITAAYKHVWLEVHVFVYDPMFKDYHVYIYPVLSGVYWLVIHPAWLKALAAKLAGETRSIYYSKAPIEFRVGKSPEAAIMPVHVSSYQYCSWMCANRATSATPTHTAIIHRFNAVVFWAMGNLICASSTPSRPPIPRNKAMIVAALCTLS
jgi:hypothetical protein